MGRTPWHSRENCSPWVNKSRVMKWPKPPPPTPCAVSRKEGRPEGEKGLLKAYYTSHYPSLTLLIINLLDTFTFKPILPLKCFLPNLSSWALHYFFSFPLLCPGESKKVVNKWFSWVSAIWPVSNHATESKRCPETLGNAALPPGLRVFYPHHTLSWDSTHTCWV